MDSVNGPQAGQFALDGLADDDGVLELTVQKPPPTSSANANITLTDVLAALKVYLGKSVGSFASPFNLIASDFNADGTVNLTDVLTLLKYYLGKDTGQVKPQWTFVDASTLVGTGEMATLASDNGGVISKTHTTPRGLAHDFSDGSEEALIGVLRGDVDGGWGG